MVDSEIFQFCMFQFFLFWSSESVLPVTVFPYAVKCNKYYCYICFAVFILYSDQLATIFTFTSNQHAKHFLLRCLPLIITKVASEDCRPETTQRNSVRYKKGWDPVGYSVGTLHIAGWLNLSTNSHNEVSLLQKFSPFTVEILLCTVSSEQILID